MKIFLSYGHDNAAEALVLRIKADLAHLGHEVWLDHERIEFGDDWRREVTEGIISSHAKVIWSFLPTLLRISNTRFFK